MLPAIWVSCGGVIQNRTLPRELTTWVQLRAWLASVGIEAVTAVWIRYDDNVVEQLADSRQSLRAILGCSPGDVLIVQGDIEVYPPSAPPEALPNQQLPLSVLRPAVGCEDLNPHTVALVATAIGAVYCQGGENVPFAEITSSVTRHCAGKRLPKGIIATVLRGVFGLAQLPQLNVCKQCGRHHLRANCGHHYSIKQRTRRNAYRLGRRRGLKVRPPPPLGQK